jgi:triosephosphate isomerase
VKYCVVGHVERRSWGETDAQINKKIKQLIANGITPVLVVGETQSEYDSNMTRVSIEKQMQLCLEGVREFDRLVLCYQPAWGIGTGHNTTPEYTNLIINFMRKTIQNISKLPMSANIPMIYGGTVTSSNAASYLEQPDIDGLLFAVAAMKPQSFADLVNTKFNIKVYNQM